MRARVVCWYIHTYSKIPEGQRQCFDARIELRRDELVVQPSLIRMQVNPYNSENRRHGHGPQTTGSYLVAAGALRFEELSRASN
jgi:hypothetical protein